MENEFDLLRNQLFIQENLSMFKQHLLTQINFLFFKCADEQKYYVYFKQDQEILTTVFNDFENLFDFLEEDIQFYQQLIEEFKQQAKEELIKEYLTQNNGVNIIFGGH